MKKISFIICVFLITFGFSQKSISIKSIIQLNTNNEKVVPIIIISDPVGIKNITQVVNNLKKMLL